VITFGQPLVKQIRNKHNLFDDLDVELENNKETDYFVDLLKRLKLTEKSYFHALYELIDLIILQDNNPPMVKSFAKEYKVWCDIVSGIV